jgi:cytochrome P450
MLTLWDVAVYLVGAVVSYLLVVSVWAYSYRNLPPGPRPMPYIGNLLNVLQYGFSRTHVLFEDCHAQYGKIFTFWFAGARAPVISVNDPMLAKQVLEDKKVVQSPCLRGRNV